MPGRKVHDIAGPELDGLADVDLDVEAPLQHQLKTVDLTRWGFPGSAQGRRPAKTRLEDATTQRQAEPMWTKSTVPLGNRRTSSGASKLFCWMAARERPSRSSTP